MLSSFFQQPFSWKALGVDIRGRSRVLRVNYRTSHQIRMQADHLLGPEVTDVEGNSEKRSDTISVFNGPPPTIRVLKSESEEIKCVGNWLSQQAKVGVLPHEFAIFVRSPAQLDRARAAVADAGIPFKVLDEHVETVSGHVSISTMHLAKGLEFRAVAVIAYHDEIIPLQGHIETVGDDADLQEVYDTECLMSPVPVREITYSSQASNQHPSSLMICAGLSPFTRRRRTRRVGFARMAQEAEASCDESPLDRLASDPNKTPANVSGFFIGEYSARRWRTMSAFGPKRTS
jgi:hypothetical protein